MTSSRAHRPYSINEMDCSCTLPIREMVYNNSTFGDYTCPLGLGWTGVTFTQATSPSSFPSMQFDLFAYQIVSVHLYSRVTQFVEKAKDAGFSSDFLKDNPERLALEMLLETHYNSIPDRLKSTDPLPPVHTREYVLVADVNLLYDVCGILLKCPAIASLDVSNAPKLEPENFASTLGYAVRITKLVK